MSNCEILKFKNKISSEDNKKHLNKSKKNINNVKSENICKGLTTPFEIYRWSYILNTNNEKLINDVIKHDQQKKKKIKKGITTQLDIYNIISRHSIIINDQENDMFLENEINNYFYSLMNNLEYYFDNYEFIHYIVKNLKKNESHIFYYIYNNFKFLHALPFKCFWQYGNLENLYIENNNDNYEYDEECNNEYLFKNVDLNKLDMLLSEDDTLNNVININEVNTKEEHTEETFFKPPLENGKHSNDELRRHYHTVMGPFKYKYNYKDRSDTYGLGEKMKRQKEVTPYMQITNESYNIHKDKKIVNDRKKCANIEYIKRSYPNKTLNNFIFTSEKKCINSMASSTISSCARKMRLENMDNSKYSRDINLNINKSKVINSLTYSTKSRCYECLNRSTTLNENTYSFSSSTDDTPKGGKYVNLKEKEEKVFENVSYDKMVKEYDFIYDIATLDKKIPNNEKSKGKNFRTSKVPVSPMSRASVFGKIIFDIVKNSSIEYVKSVLTNNTNDKKNIILNEKNAEVLANGLSKMRGVVLKLGQMISLQDEYLSPIVIKALKLVNNSADVMPESQLINVLIKELGNDYEKKFDFFNYKPFASASIGQVHEAKIKNKKVAVKIQYPGIYESIDSDIKNLLFINQYTDLILKNLYIENVCKEIKKELKCECDYINEAKYYVLFKKIFQKSKYFYVPSVYTEYITKHVLVTSYVDGITIDEVAEKYPQVIRDSLGQRILYLCLHELFVFKIMNTDPNLGNFLYNVQNDKLCLIDFGATRTYKNEFVDQYLRLVKSSVEEDEEKIYHYSCMLNFFVGQENEEMKNSHIKSVILVGEPFKSKTYDFGKNNLAKQIYNLLPKIIYNRLVPPRSEIYTLHRKLSGSYLICMKLKARVNAADIFNSIYKNYKFSVEDTYEKSV
ncbi:ABC1 family, putative [Plasmodium malariae]|nr:ABC1 family, putative [Plasmodium malariae]SCP03404.1 ABC1 family, putative [Plasmodium malariae]